MLVRVRPDQFSELVETSQEMAKLFRYLMTPVAVAGYTLAFWRLGADLNWTGQFFIADGLFSHWQVWLALAVATQLTGSFLARQSGRIPITQTSSDNLR
jgi:hypothetical protein